MGGPIGSLSKEGGTENGGTHWAPLSKERVDRELGGTHLGS